MKPTLSPTQIRLHPRGFSLIEIMVVIAIIILLAGLVIGAGRRMRQSASRSQTKIILGICKSAEDAYVTKFKPILHFNGNLEPSILSEYIYEDNWDKTTFKKNASEYTGGDYGKINDPIERFVYKALKYDLSAKILKTLNHKQLIDSDGDGFLEIRDGFDNMIEYAAYVSHKDNYKLDDFLPIHKRSFFGSSGIDGKWGDAKTTPNGDELKDNLYSYDQE
jgi:prepilin-type N-terminal cleavage/methylation domain-containing protein